MVAGPGRGHRTLDLDRAISDWERMGSLRAAARAQGVSQRSLQKALRREEWKLRHRVQRFLGRKLDDVEWARLALDIIRLRDAERSAA